MNVRCHRVKMPPLPAAAASVSLRIMCKWRSCPAGAGRGAFSRGYLSSIDQAARSPLFAKATILIFSHFASWRERYLRKMRLPPKRNVRIASAEARGRHAPASTETRLPPRTPGPLTRRRAGLPGRRLPERPLDSESELDAVAWRRPPCQWRRHGHCQLAAT